MPAQSVPIPLVTHLQSMLFSARGLARNLGRVSGGARSFRHQLRYGEDADRQSLAAFQAAHLATMLRHAARNVPFYAGLPVPRGSEPQEVFEVLSAWPLLDKQTVIGAGRAMLARNVRLRFAACSSGTTGTPMTTWRTPRSVAHEAALQERQLRWAGWRPGERRLWLRGDVVVPLSQDEPPFWRRNLAENMLMCSAFHLSPRHAPDYLAAIEAFDPVVIQAYPSAIAFLASALIDRGRSFGGRSLRAIVTSSERVTPQARQLCRQAFGVAIFDWYGQSERVAAIGTCEHGRYHLLDDASYVELLAHADGTSSLVGSAWDNFAMPLIRYQTGDRVRLGTASCACRRPFKVVDHLAGRETDTIVTPDGRHHMMLDFIFDDVDGLKEAQIVQDAPDHVTLRLVLLPGVRLDDVDVVRRRAIERLGGQVHVRLRQVDEIERAPSGKFRVIVNQLDTSSSSGEGPVPDQAARV